MAYTQQHQEEECQAMQLDFGFEINDPEVVDLLDIDTLFQSNSNSNLNNQNDANSNSNFELLQRIKMCTDYNQFPTNTNTNTNFDNLELDGIDNIEDIDDDILSSPNSSIDDSGVENETNSENSDTESDYSESSAEHNNKNHMLPELSFLLQSNAYVGEDDGNDGNMQDEEDEENDDDVSPIVPVQKKLKKTKTTKKTTTTTLTKKNVKSNSTASKRSTSSSLSISPTSTYKGGPKIRTQETLLAGISDRERKLLLTLDPPYVAPKTLPLTKLVEKELRSQLRKIRNKDSAIRSRKKKECYVKGLEAELQQSTTINVGLETKVQGLQTENKTLLEQLKELKAQLYRATASTASTSGGTVMMMLMVCCGLRLGPTTNSTSSSISGFASYNDNNFHQVSDDEGNYSDTVTMHTYTKGFKSRTLKGYVPEGYESQTDDFSSTFTLINYANWVMVVCAIVIVASLAFFVHKQYRANSSTKLRATAKVPTYFELGQVIESC